MPVEKWQVFHTFCRHTLPEPKNKFVVVVCTKPETLGFLINSRVNDYILNRPHLLPCEVPLLATNYEFLNHDSYLDCRDPYPFDEAELTELVGIINNLDRPIVLQAVGICPVIRHNRRQQILTP